MSAFNVTLSRIRRLSESTLDFRFERDDGSAVEFEPGQFFRFTFTDDEGEFERSYSLCNFGDDVTGSRFLDLVISHVENGRATRLLFNCSEGISASVTGPYGRLVLPADLPRRLFLVATSVGLAPFMPMLTKAAPMIDEGKCELHLVLGVRDPGEFIYRNELLTFAREHANFRLSVCYSRELPVKPAKTDFEGYVQSRLASLEPEPTSDRVMLCGNPGMIDEAFADLKSLGFSGREVVREKYVYARETGATVRPEMNEAQKKLLAEKMKKFQS